jgi:hypothetical protein
VGLIGSVSSIHTSLAVSASVFFCAIALVSLRNRSAAA